MGGFWCGGRVGGKIFEEPVMGCQRLTATMHSRWVAADFNDRTGGLLVESFRITLFRSTGPRRPPQTE